MVLTQPRRLALALALANLHCNAPDHPPAAETSPAQPPAEPAALQLRSTLELRPIADDSAFALALAEGHLPTGVEVRFENVGPEGGRMAVFTADDLSTLQAWSGELEPPGMRIAFEGTKPPQLHFVQTDDGFVVRGATTEVVADRYTGELGVRVSLTPEDGARFGDLSQRLMDRKLAIMLEDQVLSAPVVRERIDGGVLVINLGGDDRGPEGARALVSTLTGVPASEVAVPASE